MITYEITATVELDLVVRYEDYMRSRHIPDLLGTGCFLAATFSRSAAGRYRIRYEAADREALARYLSEHAAELRAHVAEVFPEGVHLSREEWEVLESWPVSER